jgi:hypothetical protein
MRAIRDRFVGFFGPRETDMPLKVRQAMDRLDVLATWQEPDAVITVRAGDINTVLSFLKKIERSI